MEEDGCVRGWVGCRAACWLGYTEGGRDEKGRVGKGWDGEEKKEKEVDVELGLKGGLGFFCAGDGAL